MIVNLICSFSGCCKQVSCPLSFPTDSLREQLAQLYHMCVDVVKFELEGKLVEEGTISDYVRSVQRTAYVNVYTDYEYTQPVRCFVKYHNFLRAVTAYPQDTIFNVVLACLRRSLHTEHWHIHSLCVDEKPIDSKAVIRGNVRFGSVIEVKEDWIPIPSAIPLKLEFLILDFGNGWKIHYPLTNNLSYETLLNYCSTVSDVATRYLTLQYDDNLVLSESSVLTKSCTIHVVVNLSVKDNFGKTHFYHPFSNTTIQNIITDIQNCPFVQIPLCMLNDKDEVDNSLPVWNLLSPTMDEVALYTTEVADDVPCLVLRDETRILVTDETGTIKPMTLPENAFLILEEPFSPKQKFCSVSYDGFEGIQIPTSSCSQVMDDETAYDSEKTMKVCSNWESDCPYQLTVRLGQKISVSREKQDFYYGRIIDDENHQEGWIQKPLLQ